MYGVLLPAPDIGQSCKGEMRAIRDAGFECGVHAWDHVLWQDNVRKRGAAWTREQLQRSLDRFHDIFGDPPPTHGAAGWQMNAHAFALLDEFGFSYASDGRARLTASGELADAMAGPHRIRIGSTTMSCVQLPTTLPTFDELLGRTIDGKILAPSCVASSLLALTKKTRDHVFTLHAELEGQKFAPIFKQLLAGWHEQGYDLVSLQRYYRTVRPALLPVSPLAWEQLPGRSGELIVQTGGSQ